jgi:hypothetical protein
VSIAALDIGRGSESDECGALFDDLIGERDEVRRNFNAERLRG